MVVPGKKNRDTIDRKNCLRAKQGLLSAEREPCIVSHNNHYAHLSNKLGIHLLVTSFRLKRDT